MSGLIRGALTLIQGESSTNCSHPLIGNDVEVGSMRLRVDSVIAEGGFAVVFAAHDNRDRWFALKRQLTKDREAMDAVLLEIRLLKELAGHPSILEFVAAAQMKIPSGGVEFMLVTELCSGGSVADLMKNTHLTPEQAVKIFHAATGAVCHMHNQKIPITHRDIKIENLLFDSRGHVKLCDFGSATTDIFTPDETWNMAKRTQLEEMMQRHTTPMYRAPEILDTYQNFVVGPQQDIWALGCVLFYLSYHVHPFEDSAKLRILNVVYTVPTGFDEFHNVLPIIESCLKLDPLSRPMAADLLERSKAVAKLYNVDLRMPVSNVDTRLLRRPETQKPKGSGLPSAAPPRPPAPRSSVMSEEIMEHTSAMLGSIKGQGLSLLKNLKDRSSAVVQKVQAKLISQEVTWVTSRLCIVPTTQTLLDHNDEEDWSSRVSAGGRTFVVFNLTQKSMRSGYSIEPIACNLQPVHPNVPPNIESVLRVCSSVVTFLRDRAGAAVVFYGLESHCMFLCAAVLLYCKLIRDACDAFEFVANKRRTIQLFAPSQIRALDLIKNLTSTSSVVLFPLSRPMLLCSMSLSSLPILAGIRTGLRPVVEVFVGQRKVWDSFVSKSTLSVSKSLAAELDFDSLPVDGQVTIVMSYSRANPTSASSKKFLFGLLFHTSVSSELMTLTRSDMDIGSSEENNVPIDFRLSIGLRAISEDESLRSDLSSHDSSVLQAGSPDLLVLDCEEQKQIMDWYNVPTDACDNSDVAQSQTSSVSRASAAAAADFFQTLDWSQAHLTEQYSTPMLPRDDPPPPVPHHRTTSLSKNTQSASSSLSAVTSFHQEVTQPSRTDLAELYERKAGIRVQNVEDADMNRIHLECEKETPILSEYTPPCPLTEAFDLLDLGVSTTASAAPVQSAHRVVDPFLELVKESWTAPPAAEPPSNAHHMSGDLLGEWTSNNVLRANPSSSMHRNVSAPAIQLTSSNPDPFAEFLSQNKSNPAIKQPSASNSGPTTPMPSRPNYSRAAFENLDSSSMKPKVAGDVFGDLLSSQGFTASFSKNANRTLGDLRRAEEIKNMDPVAIKIRDWVGGKERNIRALLGSLNDVLWEGAENWQQPRMGDLLSAAQVKRCYYKACLVVHPDKQVGQPHEELARAIFTELNDAWNAFEQTGCESL